MNESCPQIGAFLKLLVCRIQWNQLYETYRNSFFYNTSLAVSTAGVGSIIGNDDFTIDRIIPDCIRAAIDGKEIIVRNPFSTRPYQHMLEPIMPYLMICQAQYEDMVYVGSYNFVILSIRYF